MGPTPLRGFRATGDTLSNVESQVFTPYQFGSTAGDRTPNLLTTRPTCYHSATALTYIVYKALCQPILLVTYCEHVNVYLVYETCTIDVAMPENKPSFTP